MRIWREWLADRARHGCSRDGESSKETNKERADRLRWADNNETVGLRLRVVEREEATPVLVRKDEDPPVSYTLQYEGILSQKSRLGIDADGRRIGDQNYSTSAPGRAEY